VKVIEEQGFIEKLQSEVEKKDGTVIDVWLNGTAHTESRGFHSGVSGIARNERD
jgi:hypothetical protein